ncbi:hypothetical protein ACFOUP_18210 [Belliella kenyensis]|uniref:Carboxypeptidase regulatory-like domain-containing protein n=1 Tax=Belliella kenyensis TaxID=1472724 RepID=A0ABV8EQJ1_9BACT|nr:hypothetical protein [Belliella kenyensis]MCH7402283.1 hypothetical protein [Belliella kenyensis]MDN3601800.1 hypothetical protein [Belliella kenyensis]
MRSIRLSGLIVDAKRMKPIKSAKIVSSDGSVIGYSNENGYFNITFDYHSKGAIIFDYEIIKDGYERVFQKERWGDINRNLNNTIFFELSNEISKAEPFSVISINNTSNYTEIDKIFENEVKPEFNFNEKIKEFKKSNNGSIFKFGEHFFLVNDSGRIKLDSDADLISIDENEIVKAADLDSKIKRK